MFTKYVAIRRICREANLGTPHFQKIGDGLDRVVKLGREKSYARHLLALRAVDNLKTDPSTAGAAPFDKERILPNSLNVKFTC
jgi:hypothetical protein